MGILNLNFIATFLGSCNELSVLAEVYCIRDVHFIILHSVLYSYYSYLFAHCNCNTPKEKKLENNCASVRIYIYGILINGNTAPYV